MPGIIQHPQDNIQFVTSHEEIVVFECKVEEAISWTANSTELNLPGFISNDTVSGNITTVVLTILKVPIYNQTTFQCIGRGRDGEVAVSNEATLFYQGTVECNTESQY